jgi:anti-sigma regulatory factor (Ser/Thr protein kinase)
VPSAELTLSGEVQDVRAARHFVDDVLASWRAGDYAPVAVQIVSELATNAALHARTGFAVELQLTEAGLRVSVRDFSPRRPSRRHYAEDATTGRGLALVDALSASWGVAAKPPGKFVWADVAPVAEVAPAGSSGDADVVPLIPGQGSGAPAGEAGGDGGAARDAA